MNKFFRPLLLALTLMAAACNERMDINKEGTLSFANMFLKLDVSVSEVTKGMTKTPASIGDYYVSVINEEDDVVYHATYSSLQSSSVRLLAGAYTVRVLSAENVPEAAFETDNPLTNPAVYGAEVPVVIAAAQTTEIGAVTCKLMQCKVSIEYDDQLLDMMTGAGKASVEVTPGYPLEYAVDMEGGIPSYESRAGYFAVPGESASLSITFTALIDGKNMKMKWIKPGVTPATFRKVKLMKKVNPEGNATVDIRIDGYIEDPDLITVATSPVLDILGEDPKAPKGDGGITLAFAPDCTMFDDLSDIVVPDPAVTPMDLRLVATIPNGVKKFTVHIETNNDGFNSALDAAGGADLDLVNPSPDAGIIFQVVPFPHGADLVNRTSVDFDLSAAQDPIYPFKGKHTFYMTIVDNAGCKNTIPVSMVIGE